MIFTRLWWFNTEHARKKYIKFTQVYVYDLKKTHHYDHHNTFWDRARAQQNNNTHCLKQFYVSLNDEYQKYYSGTRRSLGS